MIETCNLRVSWNNNRRHEKTNGTLKMRDKNTNKRMRFSFRISVGGINIVVWSTPGFALGPRPS